MKIKGSPSAIRNVLSGKGGSGALVNGGAPPSRETRNKVKVDQSPSAIPKRKSLGAFLTSNQQNSQI